MSNPTVRALALLSASRYLMRDLYAAYERDAVLITSWLEAEFPDDPASIQAMNEAITGAGAAVIALETLSARIADAVRAAVVEDTLPVTEVAQA